MNPLQIIEKYYTPQTPLYNILLTHSRAVTQKALQIAEQHTELPIDKEFVAEAAMLHDIGIFLTKAPRIECFGTANYIEHGYLGADLLRKEGLERHARVCERHTGTGLLPEEIERQQLPLPKRQFCPETYEEQLICFADKFYSKTRLTEELSIEKITTSLSKFGEKSVEQFQKWLQIFG